MNIELTARQKQMTYMKDAYDYFTKRAIEIRSIYEFNVWGTFGLNFPDWELIRKLVLHSFGCSTISQLLDEQIELSNLLAIEITNALFDTNMRELDRLQSLGYPEPRKEK